MTIVPRFFFNSGGKTFLEAGTVNSYVFIRIFLMFLLSVDFCVNI